MCILFLAPQCPSTYVSGQLKLVACLEAKPEIGLCVDPTSLSPIHCTKLEVRHKGAWYEKCQWCTNLATRWRNGKVNECAEMDKIEAEKLKKSKSREMEIMRREEKIMRREEKIMRKEEKIMRREEKIMKKREDGSAKETANFHS